MRTGISITVLPAGRRRLLALVKNRNASQKHVWRAEIVLLSAGSAGTNTIMRQTGKSKTCVWRWQERFAKEGFEGLLRDKTRPSRIKPLGDEVAARIVALTLDDPPGETTHSTGALMAKGLWRLCQFGSAHLARPRASTASRAAVQALERSEICRQAAAMSSGYMSIRPPTPLCFPLTKRTRFKRSTARNLAYR